jgi:hypothetical protein
MSDFVSRFTGGFPVPWFAPNRERPEREMTYLYDGFDIESFEAGKGLWHARIRRADQQPVVIDGISFTALDIGFAWSDPQEAIADAKSHIDRFGLNARTVSHAAN